jgi:hypothetical protein
LGIGEKALALFGKLKSFASGTGGKLLAMMTGQQLTPDRPSGGGGNSNSVTSKTEIIVQGSANPEATARAVSKEQGRVNADLVRNTQMVTQ